MFAELEDTSYRRTQSVGSQPLEDREDSLAGLGPETPSPSKPTNPRAAYRHSLPVIIDEPFRRHMKTWHFDEPTKTWRPQSPAPGRLNGTRSHPNLLEKGKSMDDKASERTQQTRDCPIVLMAQLSTNVQLQNDDFVVKTLSNQLSVSFPDFEGSIVVGVQRTHSMWINGQPSRCAVLSMAIPRRTNNTRLNQRSICSLRLILANLLDTPLVGTFVIFTPAAGPPARVDPEIPTGASTGALRGHLSKRAATDPKSQFQQRDRNPCGVDRQNSMPHLFSGRSQSTWSTSGARNSTPREGPARRPSPPSPYSIQPLQISEESLDSRYPVMASHAKKRHELSFGSPDRMTALPRPRSNDKTRAGSMQPRRRNTLRKRHSYGGARPSSRDGVRALNGTPSRPRNIHGSPQSQTGRRDTPRPARLVALTTSRKSWSRADPVPVPEHRHVDSVTPMEAQKPSEKALSSSPRADTTQAAAAEATKQRSKLVTAVSAYLKKKRAIRHI